MNYFGFKILAWSVAIKVSIHMKKLCIRFCYIKRSLTIKILKKMLGNSWSILEMSMRLCCPSTWPINVLNVIRTAKLSDKFVFAWLWKRPPPQHAREWRHLCFSQFSGSSQKDMTWAASLRKSVAFKVLKMSRDKRVKAKITHFLHA